MIDTELRYGKARGEVGLSWTRHLNVFKHSIDALVQYVDLIKRHSEDEPLVLPRGAPVTQSIHPKEAQLARLSDLPGHIYARVSQAYKLWDEAEVARLTGSDPGLRRQVADTFAAILNEYRNQIANSTLLEELTYTMEAESAYMLMYTGDIDDLSQAEQYYNSILARGNRRDDATALFRLAIVYIREGRYDEALNYINTVLANIENCNYSSINKSHWVYDRARLGLAVTYWKMSQSDSPDDTTKVEYLTHSYNYALSVLNYPAVGGAENRMHALNDVLAYACAANRVQHNWIESKLNSSVFKTYITELDEYVKSKPNCSQTYIDTLLRAVEDDCDRALHFSLEA